MVAAQGEVPFDQAPHQLLESLEVVEIEPAPTASAGRFLALTHPAHLPCVGRNVTLDGTSSRGKHVIDAAGRGGASTAVLRRLTRTRFAPADESPPSSSRRRRAPPRVLPTAPRPRATGHAGNPRPQTHPARWSRSSACPPSRCRAGRARRPAPRAGPPSRPPR